ncbi:nuclear transport factor 2 family protein [Flavihumibacter sp.]|uniref:nuclear transport factor 2 family protein n=1 Tax=Flavihumibacter sp. TaxID=1913981 RepID=UPI002FC86919|nr:nuclear transport factor 2 family protein [Flavihumibacter sediminis]
MRDLRSFSCFYLLLLLTFACSTTKNTSRENTASPPSTVLYNTIDSLDGAMFDAFNKRDISNLQSFLSEELEFYHDLGGVTNYEQNIETFNRTFASERKLRRALVAGSMEVYAIKDFGAVQTGVHRFYVTEKGQKEKLSSEAKFVNLWQGRNGVWKITRIISYGHLENLE